MFQFFTTQVGGSLGLWLGLGVLQVMQEATKLAFPIIKRCSVCGKIWRVVQEEGICNWQVIQKKKLWLSGRCWIVALISWWYEIIIFFNLFQHGTIPLPLNAYKSRHHNMIFLESTPGEIFYTEFTLWRRLSAQPAFGPAASVMISSFLCASAISLLLMTKS